MFWMRNKDNNFPIHALIWRPGIIVITSFNINVHSEPSSILKQMLMLQQQIYQEEQTPIGELQNNSTQFYSHYSKQSYTSSYYMNQQTWQPYGGCYQEKYQQKNYNNGYKCKFKHVLRGVQWLSGRVLDLRPRGRGFEPHQHYCVLSLSKTHSSLLSTGST